MDIHRCRFVDFPPSAINALAFSHSANPRPAHDQGRLAVGRANGSIEIWNPLNGVWHHESTFSGGKDRSIEGLAWVQEPEDENEQGQRTQGALRLFSIGSSSAVTEWDLGTGLPIRQSTGNHSEAWCIASQPPHIQPQQQEQRTHQKIAVGCADGSVVLLSTEDGGLAFERFVARTSQKKARALCITWKNRNILAVGYADSTIRLYSIAKNRKDTFVRTISLGGGQRGGRKEKLIWALDSLPDGTLVSGDSTGEVCWWDRDNYGQLQRIQAHEADVLCLATSADGKTVFSGGIDRRTVIYNLSSNASFPHQRWAKGTHKRIHTQDVKTMASLDVGKISVVVSGGPDAHLTISPIRNNQHENHRRIPFVPQTPPVTSAKRLVLSWWNNHVTVWRVSRDASGKRQRQDLSNDTFKIVAQMGLKGEENISTASITEDGKLLAISTMAETKLFHLRRVSKGPADNFKISKISTPDRLSKSGARLLRFSPDGRWLAQVTPSNRIIMHEVMRSDNDRCVTVPGRNTTIRRLRRPSLNRPWDQYLRRIVCMTFDSRSGLVTVADLAGYIDVWQLERAVAHAPDADLSDVDSSSEEDSVVNGSTNMETAYRWQHTPASDSPPRMTSAPLILSYCPQRCLNDGSGISDGREYNGDVKPESRFSDRVVVVSATHDVSEYSILQGRLTYWSRRNPSKSLPASLRLQRDRAMGCVWDCSNTGVNVKKRLWLYGATWLCMIEMSQDLPIQQSHKAIAAHAESVNPLNAHDRKRKREEDSQKQLLSKRRTTGAGSKTSRNRPEQARINEAVSDGKGASQKRTADHEDDDQSEDEAHDNDMAVMRRTAAAQPNMSLDGDASDEDVNVNGLHGDESKGQGLDLTARGAENSVSDAQAPPYYITTKYRPIIGVVPLLDEEEAEDQYANGERGERPDHKMLEVALIERPEQNVAMSEERR